MAINESDKDGDTVLHHASYKGKLEVVQWLVGLKKIDLNKKNNDGFTALFWALFMSHTKVALWLMNNGAEDNELPRSKLTRYPTIR